MVSKLYFFLTTTFLGDIWDRLFLGPKDPNVLNIRLPLKLPVVRSCLDYKYRVDFLGFIIGEEIRAFSGTLVNWWALVCYTIHESCIEDATVYKEHCKIF